MKRKTLDDLNEFYRNVISTFYFRADSDGFVKAISPGGDEKNDMQMLHNKLPVVLPTKNNNKSFMALNDKKEMERVKFLYNPLYENLLSGDNPSLIRSKTWMESRLASTIANVIDGIIAVASDKEKEKKASLYLQSLISTLGTSNTKNKKNKVDEKTLSSWEKITDSATAGTKTKDGICHFYTKKGGKYKGESFIRLCTLKFPLYDQLDNIDKDKKIFGYKLRRDDIDVYLKLYQAIISDLPIDDENYLSNMVIHVGSNHEKSPGFISLYKLYIMVMSKLITIAKDISKVLSSDIIDDIIIKIPYQYDEIDDLADELSIAADLVPKDAVISTTATNTINSNIESKSKESVTQRLLAGNLNNYVAKPDIPTVKNNQMEVTMNSNEVTTQRNNAPAVMDMANPTTPLGLSPGMNSGNANATTKDSASADITRNLANAIMQERNAINANYSINNNPVNIRVNPNNNNNFGNNTNNVFNNPNNPYANGNNNVQQQNNTFNNPMQQNTFNNPVQQNMFNNPMQQQPQQGYGMVNTNPIVVGTNFNR